MDNNRRKLFAGFIENYDFSNKTYEDFVNTYFGDKESSDALYEALVNDGAYTKSLEEWNTQYCGDLPWMKPSAPGQTSDDLDFKGLDPLNKPDETPVGAEPATTKTDGTDYVSQLDPTKKKWSMVDNIPKPVVPPVSQSAVAGATWKDINVSGDQIKAGSLVRYGEKGDIVKQIQNLLIKHDFPNISKNNIPDGLFGTRTLNSVKQFQTANGLKPDGIVGPLTWEKLNSEPNVDLSNLSTKPNEFNSSTNPEYGTNPGAEPLQEARKFLKEIYKKYVD